MAMLFKDHKAAVHHKNASKLDGLSRQLLHQVGFALESYGNIVDHQILKKARILAVEKMRTIQLMVAVFNMNNKRTGRLAMKRAKKAKLTLWEQGGSRKDQRAAYSLVDKVLSMDIVRF